jgi:hypothetical protein
METATDQNSVPADGWYRRRRSELIAEIRRLRSRIARQDVEIYELQQELMPLLKSVGWEIAELRQKIEQIPKPGE